MNRAQTVIRNLEEAFEKRARVHPDHVAALDKRLKERGVPHHKYSQPAYFGGLAYGVYGIRPEAWQPFMSCCDDCQKHSGSSAPVTMTAGQTGGAEGGYSGDASGSSVAAT